MSSKTKSVKAALTWTVAMEVARNLLLNAIQREEWSAARKCAGEYYKATLSMIDLLEGLEGQLECGEPKPPIVPIDEDGEPLR